MLIAETLSMPLHREVTAEAPGTSRLVCLPLPGQTGTWLIGNNCKGSAPHPDGRRDLPQLGSVTASPVI